MKVKSHLKISFVRIGGLFSHFVLSLFAMREEGQFDRVVAYLTAEQSFVAPIDHNVLDLDHVHVYLLS